MNTFVFEMAMIVANVMTAAAAVAKEFQLISIPLLTVVGFCSSEFDKQELLTLELQFFYPSFLRVMLLPSNNFASI